MTPVWFLAALLAALVLLARFGSVFPHRPLVILLLAPAFLSLWMVAMPGIWPAVAVVDGLLALVAVVDLLSIAKEGQFAVERQVGLTASLGQNHPVTLTVSNRDARDQPVWVRDGVPEGVAAEPDEFCVQLPARSRSTLRYQIKPERRGEFFFDGVYLRVRSRWGLWQRTMRLDGRSRVNVYPDMKQLGEYAVLARTNRLSLMGVRRTRRIGQDNEFERLRDYTRDDNYKHIDWRSTARRQRLTVRDFQANQSQRVIFLVDCGRMMTGEVAGVSLLDHALNAALLMSFVALRRGDQVGMMCFSDAIHSFVPPKGGREQTNRLLHAAFNRFPRMVESRYDEAFVHLASTARKRALVVLITNVVDEVNATQVRERMANLRGRHLPMAVVLRDHALFDAADSVEEQFAASPAAIDDGRLFRAAAAAEMLTWRRHVLADLEAGGALLVDAFPEDLTAPLVNR
ncbi:MAG: DUF58 domain-containing protein, partial [Planctomycetota bacterium]